MRLLGLLVVAAFATLAASCANRTGDQTIADYCADPGRANYDICKQHTDIEGVRSSLGARIGEVSNAANRAQATADQAMARQMTCSTRTVRRSRSGSCENGAVLTSCTQTHYGTRAGGLAVLRSISDTECRFNSRVLEMQVRCCTVGAPITQTTDVAPAPAPQTPAPRPTS